MSSPYSTLRFGICTDQNRPWPELRDRWQHYEALGFTSIWDCDHYQQPSRPEGPFYEGWTLLAALATQTSTVEIGTLVSSNTFRHPALLAKMASTIDHVSNGRLQVGLGAGWYKPEHEAFGIDFPQPKELVDRFEESVVIIDSMLRNEVTTFDGRYYKLDNAPARPLPIQQPRPPLTLAAHGPRMLGIVATYADRWNSFGTVEELKQRNHILDERCDRIGRDPAAITRSMYDWSTLLPIDPWSSLNAFEEMIGSYTEAGIEEFIIDAPGDEQSDVLEKVAADIVSSTHELTRNRAELPSH